MLLVLDLLYCKKKTMCLALRKNETQVLVVETVRGLAHLLLIDVLDSATLKTESISVDGIHALRVL